MPLRVIAGQAKGRRLKSVPGDTTRPIMDRVKEALFNIIGRDIYDANFLDLFAGTGSVGIEALSRGAKHALFLDMERRAIQTIQENLKLTKFEAQAQVIRTNALNHLKHTPDRPYHFIYVAPPQYKNLWQETLTTLEANPAWIPEGTRVIVQIDPSEQKALTLDRLKETDERRYGKTLLWFFTAQAPENSEG